MAGTGVERVWGLVGVGEFNSRNTAIYRYHPPRPAEYVISDVIKSHVTSYARSNRQRWAIRQFLLTRFQF